MGEKLWSQAEPLKVSIRTCFSLDVRNFEFKSCDFRDCIFSAIFNLENIRFDRPNHGKGGYVNDGRMSDCVNGFKLDCGELAFPRRRNMDEVVGWIDGGWQELADGQREPIIIGVGKEDAVGL